MKIHKKFALLVPLLLSYGLLYGETAPSKMEKQFIYHSKICEHTAGEFGDQTPERNKSLNKAMDENCPKAKKLANVLLKQNNLSRATYESFILMENVGLKLTSKQRAFFCKKANSDWGVLLCNETSSK